MTLYQLSPLIMLFAMIPLESVAKKTTAEDCFALKNSKASPEQKGLFFSEINAYNSNTVKTAISAMSHTCNVTLVANEQVFDNLKATGWTVLNSDGQPAKSARRGILTVGSGRSYVAYHPKLDVLIVVFRGTGVQGKSKERKRKKNKNIITDLKIKQIEVPWLPSKKKLREWKALSKERLKSWRALKVHKGFGEEYAKFQAKIGNRVGSFLRASKHTPAVYCLGFSLGAALATQCAAHLQLKFGLQPYLLVGASPRVGSQQFQNTFDRVIKNSLRVMLAEDPIVQIPGLVAEEKYEHVGRGLLPLFSEGKAGKIMSKDALQAITHSGGDLNVNFKKYHESSIYKRVLTQHLEQSSNTYKSDKLLNLAKAERAASYADEKKAKSGARAGKKSSKSGGGKAGKKSSKKGSGKAAKKSSKSGGGKAGNNKAKKSDGKAGKKSSKSGGKKGKKKGKKSKR